MTELAELIAAVAWPAVIVAGFWYFRRYIVDALDAARRQFSAGARLKWKDFEFEGVNLVAFTAGNVKGYRWEPASKELHDKRAAKYGEQKNLFLVHRVAATGDVHARSGLPLYDVLIKLARHKHYGRLNDVKHVEYYLGRGFVRGVGEHGARYIVEDGTDGFAVRVDAYGPTLCEATIHFHDGSVTSCSRYLDFEGTGYIYDAGKDALVEAQRSSVTGTGSNL